MALGPISTPRRPAPRSTGVPMIAISRICLLLLVRFTAKGRPNPGPALRIVPREALYFAFPISLLPALGPEGTPAQGSRQRGTSTFIVFRFSLRRAKNETRA